MCATAGCGRTVYARRVPKDAQAAPATPALTPAASDEDAVREVDFHVPQPKNAGHRGQPRVAEPEPGPAAAGDDEQVVRADSVVVPQPAGLAPEPPQPRGQSGLVDEHAGRPAQQNARRIFRHPLDW